ncbi:MAG TPA: hypothetical protein VKA87_08750 [Nitrososphaeraceae archaeon]|nr:hypothetical protein [Nitrososphaeraceae archaeon]
MPNASLIFFVDADVGGGCCANSFVVCNLLTEQTRLERLEALTWLIELFILDPSANI